MKQNSTMNSFKVINQTIDQNPADRIIDVIESSRHTSLESDANRENIPSLKAWKLLRVFREFRFKGFGVVVAKSMTKWLSFGVGVRIPLSANFPDYDRHLHLPKVSSMIGFSYPFYARCALSVSVPLQVVAFMIYRGIDRSNALRVTLKHIIESLNRRGKGETQSLQRVGLTVLIRYNRAGLQCVIGPWIAQTPSKVTVNRYVTPALLFPPALLITVLNSIILAPSTLSAVHSRDVGATLQTSKNTTMSAIPTTNITDSTNITDINSTLCNSSIMSNGTIERTVFDMSPKSTSIRELNSTTERSMSSKKKRSHGSVKRELGMRWRGVSYWHRYLSECTKRKTLVASASLGWYKTHYDAFMGFTVNFELSPFYPIRRIILNTWKLISRKLLPQNEDPP